jgi:hypothetical protein
MEFFKNAPPLRYWMGPHGMQQKGNQDARKSNATIIFPFCFHFSKEQTHSRGGTINVLD